MFLSESNYASLCTFLLQLSWGLHLQFFPFADYPCAILVTAFTIFPICRLSLLYTCDCIRTFFHLQIIFPSEPVTAFTIILICRLSLLYICDRIRNFSHLQIIFPSEPVTAFTIFLICRLSSAPHLPYDCVWGCLQAGLSPQEACFPPPFC